jgi:uncharacterized protein (TIGR00369 family)
MTTAVATKPMTGLEQLAVIARGDIPPPPMVRLLGLSIDHLAEGRVSFSAQPAEAHYNGLGTVHGGFLATLADTALGCAIHSDLDAGKSYTTTELHITYVRAVTAATGTLRCHARVVHLGRRLATAEARIVDDDGTLYATATTSCMVLEPRSPTHG